MQKLWVYNFNKTVYNGNVNFDFLVFALSKKISIIFYLPIILFYKILNLFRIIGKKTYVEKFYSFMSFFDDKNSLVEDFWKKYDKKIDESFLDTVNDNKICIISDVPEFLLKGFFASKNKIIVIGNKYNLKTGNIDGKYCDGNEKLKRLDNKKIERIYTCFEDDLPLINIAQEAFYCYNGKCRKWDENVIRKRQNYKVAFGLFVLFLTFYLILGIFLSYNYNFKDNYDLLFDSDSSRVINDFSDSLGNHNRIKVHLLYVILIQPIILLINGITSDSMLSLIIFSSIISSLSVVFIYLIGSLFNDNQKFKILLSCLFGFSFSYFIFTSGIEVYNVAALFLIILWYQVIKVFKAKDICKKDFWLLVLLGVSSLAFTVTNYFIFLIISLILLLSKKINFKKVLLINVLIIIIAVGLSFLQNLVWGNTSLIYEFDTNYDEEQKYTDYNVNFDKVKDVVKDIYINSLVSSEVSLESNGGSYNIITFGETRICSIIVFAAFYGLIIYFLVKNFKKNLLLNIGVILAFIFNTGLHLFYGSQPFLYSCHFLYLSFILLFINYKPFKQEKYNKILDICLLIILLVEIVVNFISFRSVLSFVRMVLPATYFRRVLGSFDLLIMVLFVIFISYLLICVIYKNVIKKNKKILNVLIIVACFYALSLIFVSIKTAPVYGKIFGIHLNNVNQSEEQVLSLKSDYDIRKKFTSEYDSYMNYFDEYSDFISNYDTELVDIGEDNYYLFGFGNRTKLMYKNGKIINLESGKVLYKWDVADYLIIPNDYTVVLMTKDKKKIKIFENEDGVFVIDDEKKVINGTDKHINLEEFTGQKYQNMKKVLYGEILFNIKDSIPYPNIFVYDKPWYRDGAMMAMVLNETNNVDLIEEWISDIDDIYDRQNAGNREQDNLGELLYIISVSKNDHKDLLQKIRNEADKIASDNDEGYYLSGITDGMNHVVYQNKWYNFGIKELGLDDYFVYDDLYDSYDGLTWWFGKDSSAYFEENLSDDFPYLAIAQYHKTGKGKIYLNDSLYPISYERYGSEADYSGMKVIDDYFVENKLSPVHSWTASEFLLFLLDETGDLKLE